MDSKNTEQDPLQAQGITVTNGDAAALVTKAEGRSKKTLPAAAAALVLVLMVSMMTAGKSPAATNKGAKENVPVEGMSKLSPPCTLKECLASNCNFKVAPFTCLTHNGGPHGGCSPVVWTPETCTTQCNLSGCDSLVIPEGSDSCVDVKCPDDLCESGNKCGTAAPYMCTAGSANNGCADDPFQWTLRSADSTCSGCCDITAC